MRHTRPLDIFCTLGIFFLAAACSSTSNVPFEKPWIPVNREERQMDWTTAEQMQGLLVQSNEGALSFEIPFSEILPHMTAALHERDTIGRCLKSTVDTLRNNIQNQIPEDWGYVGFLASWTISECEQPRTIEQVSDWLIKTEELISSSESNSLKKWARKRWVKLISENRNFWSQELQLDESLRNAFIENFKRETPYLPKDTKKVRKLWWSHILTTHDKKKQGKEIREKLMLFTPSQNIINTIKQYYPHEYPPMTSLLPPKIQLKHASALLDYGETRRSLKIARSIYKKEEDDLEHKASLLIEKIYRARGEPQKMLHWRLKNRRKALEPQKTRRKKQTKREMAFIPDPSKKPQAFYDYIRTLWNMNRTTEAKNIISTSLHVYKQKLPRKIQLRMRFLIARIHMEENKWLQARAQLAILAHEKPEFHSEVLWNLGLTQLILGHYADAKRTLLQHVQSLENELEKTQSLYWVAYCEHELRQYQEELATIDKILAINPVSYYSEMALQDLRKNFGKFHSPRPPAPSLFLSSPNDEMTLVTNKTNPVSDSRAQEFMFLLLLEEELAKLWLKKHPRRKIPLEWKTAIGSHIQTIPEMVKWRRDFKTQLPNYFPRLYFPREHWKTIEEVGTRYGVDPFLILSIIRQESIFQEDAVSVAKAMGMMQLLPAVASAMHKELPKSSPLKHKEFYPERLYDPVWCIELGTWFLRKLLKRYNNNWIAAIGAYNGGPTAMKHWIKSRYHPNPSLFIERIPYNETKNYIKLVLRNYANYRRIYTGFTPIIPMLTPGGA